VTKAGVKLLDFGLAKQSDIDATVTMAVMGTPAYMSPEQWEGIAYSAALIQNGSLTWFERGGNSLATAGPEGDYTDFRLSPNERSLAVSLVDPKPGTVDLWMNDLGPGWPGT
jgi:serine/threonine protein kinase